MKTKCRRAMRTNFNKESEMNSRYDLDNGMAIVSSLCGQKEWHICISEKSGLWTQPPNQFKTVMDEARELLPYAKELQNIDVVALSYGWEENMCVEHHAVCQIEEVLSELKNVENNPLADEDIKQSARNILKQYAQYQTKKGLQRRPPSTIRKRVILRDNSTCRYCDKELKKKEIHIDHVIPYSLGGRTEVNNLVVACTKCNLKKSGHTLEEINMKIINV